MRLSEAILLGRHLIEQPKSIDVTACAIAMACRANGYIPTGATDVFAYRHLRTTWPWLSKPRKSPCNCPYTCVTDGVDSIWHLFDSHVVNNSRVCTDWTLEQLCDWVRSVEPSEPSSEDVNAVRLPDVSGNELSGERTQNTLSSDRQLVHK